MAKAPIVNISDKLEKVNETFSINMYDNGFMIEFSGRDSNDEWCSVKLLSSTIEDLFEYIKQASNMERE